MKKLFLFLLILPFVFVSCGSDDDDVDYSADIVGTWNFSKITSLSFETNNKQVNQNIGKILEMIDWEEASLGAGYAYLMFTNDGKYVTEGNGEKEEGTYKLDGKTLLTYPNDGSAAEKYTISIKQNRLHLSADIKGEALEKTIVELQDDPDFISMIEEMEQYGVKLTRMSMSMEFRK